MPLKTSNCSIATKSSDRKLNSSSSQRKYRAQEYTIHKPSECNQVLNKKSIHLKRCTYDNKEIIRAMDKEGFRSLLIPSTEPNVYPKIISNTEFTNLLERTRNPSKQEKEAALAAAEREKERLLQECMARKESIRHMDMQKTRANQGRMSEIEKEARERTMNLLQRAHDIELENEEQIKKCNKLILETKCRAVRDAQIAEKKLLKREDVAEEQRVNELMEKDRVSAIRAEELKAIERVKSRQHFAQFLKKQIEANERERLLMCERKREESRLVNISSIAQQEAKLEKQKEKIEEKERARRALAQCNEQLKHIKAMEEEENRIMDIRIQNFHREKAERDAKIAEELRQEHLRKEREKHRIAEQTSQSRELQALLDDMNTIKMQEDVEREWRQREKEKALLHAENQKNLRLMRDQQIMNKMQIQAMESEREKQEFEKILKLQKEAVCREQREREKKYNDALLHRSEILKQVNEKEKEKIMSRQKMYEEGLEIRAENELRNQRIREAMERKYQQMVENNVPNIYINEVKRNIDKIK